LSKEDISQGLCGSLAQDYRSYIYRLRISRPLAIISAFGWSCRLLRWFSLKLHSLSLSLLKNFTYNFWSFITFTIKYSKKCQFRVSIFQFFLISTPHYNFLLYSIKILKIPILFLREKKNCKDLSVGQNLTKFAKIPMPESLNFFFFYFKKKVIWEFWQDLTKNSNWWLKLKK